MDPEPSGSIRLWGNNNINKASGLLRIIIAPSARKNETSAIFDSEKARNRCMESPKKCLTRSPDSPSRTHSLW